MGHMAQFTAEMKSNGPPVFPYVFIFEVKIALQPPTKCLHVFYFDIYSECKAIPVTGRGGP
jgi:hypothetical protein